MINSTQPSLSQSAAQETTAPAPYPPSFIDRFMNRIRRLPVPYGATYLVLFIVQVIFGHAIAWLDGWQPVFTPHPLLFLYPLWQWLPFAIMTYLNALSRWALTTLAPLLNLTAEEMSRLKYEFTSMPNRYAIMSGVFWAVIYLVFMAIAFGDVIAAYNFGALFSFAIFIIGLITFSTGSVLYLHSIRQLLLVYRTVKKIKQFSLFQLDPIYAFSVVTSRTGVAWIILLSLTLLTGTGQFATVPTFTMLVVQVALALAAFILPLRVVNQRLVAEKSRLLAEHSQRVAAMLAKLNRCIDGGELSGVAQLNDAISGLNAQRDILTSIPTWPWRAGLLRGFLSIVVLPIILFLMQLAIERWMSR